MTSHVFDRSGRGKRATVAVLACLLLLSAFSDARAALVSESAPFTIQKYFAYGDYGDGDVIVYLNEGGVLDGCDGLWISSAQPGARNIFATMLAAKLSGAKLTAAADNGVIWPGTVARFCKVYFLGLS